MEFKTRRIQYINDWPNVELFDAEKEYLEKYSSCKINFETYSYKVYEDKDYNIVISNIMDAIDNMPARPDIAFEFFWKAIDYFLYKISPNKNNKEQLQDLIRNVLVPSCRNNTNMKNLFEEYFALLPEKTSRYLYRNLFQGYEPTKSKDEQDKLIRQIHGRIRDYHGESTSGRITSILNYIATEYGYNPETAYQSLRNGWRFLRKLLSGETLNLKYEITYSGKKVNSISLSIEERMNFFLNGILYSFRNDRFHGALISPFRSSKTTYETYSHPTYCLLLADLVLLILLEKCGFADENDILIHSKNNLEYFKEMF